jgi:hypothetical protein
MARSYVHQRLCGVHRLPIYGRDGDRFPGPYMVHCRPPWWIRHRTSEEGLLVSHSDYTSSDKVSQSFFQFATTLYLLLFPSSFMREQLSSFVWFQGYEYLLGYLTFIYLLSLVNL